MRNFFLILSFLFFVKVASAQSDDSRPKLVVGIVVDQMRQEYLSRFYDHFGEGGFKRLMNDGYVFKNAHYNYVPTETGPGHSSVYTGTTPRVHGIIGNDWYDKGSGKTVNCVEDLNVSNVAGSSSRGNRSPNNLLSTTITDEMRLFFQDRTKIISISIKDRGAILPGGHNPNGAFWYDGSTGEFMTSTYYSSELPDWVKDFNKKKLPDSYMKQKWETLLPIEKYIESEKDDRPYEKALHESIPPVFPYDLKEISKKRSPYGLVPNTPFGNTILVELALEALKNEQMGLDAVTDFLAVSFSTPDYVGHSYGPYSKEIQDTYIRLDRELERMFSMIDRQVGVGNWSLFLTADHGVVAIPKGLEDKKMKGEYWIGSEVKPVIKSDIETRFDAAGLVELVDGHQIYFNRKVMQDKELDFESVKSYAVDFLIKQEGIVAAYDAQKVHGYEGKSKDALMVSAGVNPVRSGDVVFLLGSGWLTEYYLKGGTGHGSQYSYDTHVPMIFYGKGVKKGNSVQYKPITSIAPTISMLLGIGIPDGCSGQPLEDALILD